MVWIIRPWEVIDIETKWLFGIGIVAAAIASVYFIIKLDLNNAVLAMVALFSLTNGARAKTFREQGMARESKWMLWMSLFFGFAFVVLLIFNSVR
ncbi:hypothetical protein [Sporosarcina sp. E16_8]|uniref:hypothetical protein n=1 Tax=Sporosarcina sp. E16_8 TaxID=2789295 RepID=UPI001C4A1CD5|nr:hypothetical protein [Sporosarcina sp. E16_8]